MELPSFIRLGTRNKKLIVEVAGQDLWSLRAIDLLAAPARIRFFKWDAMEMAAWSKEVDWSPYPHELGIVRHKAVLARIVATQGPSKVVELINTLAREYEEGPIIQNGFLSDEHGKIFLTAPELGWGWRLERGEKGWYVGRYNSKRVRPVTASVFHFSRYGSLCLPVHEFIASIVDDFGTFADPYSLKELIKKKRWGPISMGHYVDIPWTTKEAAHATGNV